MRPKWQLFADAYCVHWNATRAAKEAGYESKAGNTHTHSQIGYMLLREPEVAAYIKERLKESAMGAEEALRRVGDLARATLDDFGEVTEDGKFRIDLRKAEERGRMHLIKRITTNAAGETVIELHDAFAAQQILMKHLGLLTERLQMSGTVTSAEADLSKLSVEELLEFERLLAKASHIPSSGEGGASETES